MTLSLIAFMTIRHIRERLSANKRKKNWFPDCPSWIAEARPRTSFRVTFCMIYIESLNLLSPYISVPNLEWSRTEKGKHRGNSVFGFDKRWFSCGNEIEENEWGHSVFSLYWEKINKWNEIYRKKYYAIILRKKKKLRRYSISIRIILESLSNIPVYCIKR